MFGMSLLSVPRGVFIEVAGRFYSAKAAEDQPPYLGVNI